MAMPHSRSKFYRSFTLFGASSSIRGEASPWLGRDFHMVGIAIAMFIAVFGWGSMYFGWSDPEGKVQLALATCFILGVISGYKAKS